MVEWLAHLSLLSGDLAQPLQALATTLENIPVPVTLRRQIGETIALGAETDLKNGNRGAEGAPLSFVGSS